MCGHVVLVRKTDGLEQSTKLKLTDLGAADGVRGLEASGLDVVAAELTTKAEVDALIGVLQTVRECLPG